MLTRRSAADRDAAPVVLLDPAIGAADAANAIDWFEASPDGSLVAVGISEGGTEDSVLRVLATTDGHDLGEAIPRTRACSVAWEPDSSGFAYTRYPPDDQYHRTVHHHRLGDRWDDDPVVWAEHPDPQAWPDVTVSPDGTWLLVHVLVGWARTDVHLLDRATGTWTTVIVGVEATSAFEFSDDGEALVGVTTLEASKGRLVRVPLGVGDTSRWETLVPEGDAVLSRARGPRRRAAGRRHPAGGRQRAAVRPRRAAARCRGGHRRRDRRGRAQRRSGDRLGVHRGRLVRRPDVVVASGGRWARRPLVRVRVCFRRGSADDGQPGHLPVA